jgi:hypothetical protein
MRAPRLSEEEREEWLRRIDEIKTIQERKRRLFNRKYRKTPLFIAAWVLRLLYIALFFMVLMFEEKSIGYREEVVLEKNTETYMSYGRRRVSITETTFETKYNTYSSKLTGNPPPPFRTGDTLLIERNIFYKPIYYTKKGWLLKYPVYFNWIWYAVILFFTFVSLPFNDGLDGFTHKILWVMWVLNLIGIYFYIIS